MSVWFDLTDSKVAVKYLCCSVKSATAATLCLEPQKKKKNLQKHNIFVWRATKKTRSHDSIVSLFQDLSPGFIPSKKLGHYITFQYQQVLKWQGPTLAFNSSSKIHNITEDTVQKD